MYGGARHTNNYACQDGARDRRGLQVDRLIDFRGSLFLCGHKCFAPLGRYGDPCFGAAKRRGAKILPAQQGNGTIWLNSVSAQLSWN